MQESQRLVAVIREIDLPPAPRKETVQDRPDRGLVVDNKGARRGVDRWSSWDERHASGEGGCLVGNPDLGPSSTVSYRHQPLVT